MTQHQIDFLVCLAFIGGLMTGYFIWGPRPKGQMPVFPLVPEDIEDMERGERRKNPDRRASNVIEDDANGYSMLPDAEKDNRKPWYDMTREECEKELLEVWIPKDSSAAHEFNAKHFFSTTRDMQYQVLLHRRDDPHGVKRFRDEPKDEFLDPIPTAPVLRDLAQDFLDGKINTIPAPLEAKERKK